MKGADYLSVRNAVDFLVQSKKTCLATGTPERVECVQGDR